MVRVLGQRHGLDSVHLIQGVALPPLRLIVVIVIVTVVAERGRRQPHGLGPPRSAFPALPREDPAQKLFLTSGPRTTRAAVPGASATAVAITEPPRVKEVVPVEVELGVSAPRSQEFVAAAARRRTLAGAGPQQVRVVPGRGGGGQLEHRAHCAAAQVVDRVRLAAAKSVPVITVVV